MKLMKMIFRLAFGISLVAAIITHNVVIAAGSLAIASFNLGIIIGERSKNEAI